MSRQYNDAIGQWTVVGRSMRPRDALKRIAAELDGIDVIADLDEVRRRLAVIREKTELGLAFGDRTRPSHPTKPT
ncbi:hypothetical protein MKK65_26485 [Methylobacterium sp. J-001]|uniref:hypothetical protein n=1 Tax=Methylobacterium sp. J-001 TaxID=2836609 RepID=UPI001FBB5B4B|nr:hypothetical protein [Methylobacterium sp. J-001]MCJ2120078.1 hypothetical protein [Methylobacterium sp. J-001]